MKELDHYFVKQNIKHALSGWDHSQAFFIMPTGTSCFELDHLCHFQYSLEVLMVHPQITGEFFLMGAKHYRVSVFIILSQSFSQFSGQFPQDLFTSL